MTTSKDQKADVLKVDVVESTPKVELEVMPPADMSATETSFRYDIDATIKKAETFTADLNKHLGTPAE